MPIYENEETLKRKKQIELSKFRTAFNGGTDPLKPTPDEATEMTPAERMAVEVMRLKLKKREELGGQDG